VPEIVIESVQSITSAPSNETFVEKLIQNEKRIDQVTGNALAVISPNLASVNILKMRDNQALPTNSSSFRNASSTEYFAFELRQMIDSNGNRVENIDQQPWKISGPQNLKRNGLAVQTYVASGVVNITSKSGLSSGKANVEVTVELFAEAGMVEYGDSSIRVFPGSVKFSYRVDRWPFSSVSDRLYFGIRSIASGSGGVYSEGNRLKVGDGFIDTPAFAQADAKDVPINVFYEKSSSNEAFLLFEFPAFFSTLYYDPVASLSSNSFANAPENVASSWFSGTNIIYVSCGAVVFVIGSAIFAIAFYRKRSRSLHTFSKSKTTQLVRHKNGKNRAIAF
jgi:hypothetical protein